MSYLYWIHLPEHTDIKTQGYVGISTDVQKRFEGHKKKPNKHLKNAFNKYNNNVVVDTIIEEDEDFCLLLEQELRPKKNIGWNIAVGGGKPPPSEKGRGKGIIKGPHSEEHKRKIGLANSGFNPNRCKPRGSYGPHKNPSGPRGPHKTPRAPYSEEVRKRMSERMMGTKQKPETVQKRLATMEANGTKGRNQFTKK